MNNLKNSLKNTRIDWLIPNTTPGLLNICGLCIITIDATNPSKRIVRNMQNEKESYCVLTDPEIESIKNSVTDSNFRCFDYIELVRAAIEANRVKISMMPDK